jgi:hypothetical protein
MSRKNGDKARFGRQRKQKILQRKNSRASRNHEATGRMQGAQTEPTSGHR